MSPYLPHSALTGAAYWNSTDALTTSSAMSRQKKEVHLLYCLKAATVEELHAGQSTVLPQLLHRPFFGGEC